MGTDTRSKVARVIDEYDLEGLGDRLERYWLGAGGAEYSLRELERFFNERVLEAAMRDAGAQPLEGEVENAYRLLTTDEASRGSRVQLRKSLEREGVPVEEVTADFVSHQAIHTYLRTYRDVEKPRSEGRNVQNLRSSVQKLKNRSATVVQENVENLSSNGQLAVGDYSVIVSFQVYCEDCETRYAVDELLERGECRCDIG